VAQKVRHYQESSLHRIKNRQCGSIEYVTSSVAVFEAATWLK